MSDSLFRIMGEIPVSREWLKNGLNPLTADGGSLCLWRRKVRGEGHTHGDAVKQGTERAKKKKNSLHFKFWAQYGSRKLAGTWTKSIRSLIGIICQTSKSTSWPALG